jgi:hypothetical protein
MSESLWFNERFQYAVSASSSKRGEKIFILSTADCSTLTHRHQRVLMPLPLGCDELTSLKEMATLSRYFLMHFQQHCIHGLDIV